MIITGSEMAIVKEASEGFFKALFKGSFRLPSKIKNYLLSLPEKLNNYSGVGLAKACQIMAEIEFSKKFLIKDGVKVKNTEDVVRLTEELKDKKQEYFLSLTLDGASNLIQKRTVFIGTLNQSIVHPREVFADAISNRAAGIVFVHNHPSGDVTPSKILI